MNLACGRLAPPSFSVGNQEGLRGGNAFLNRSVARRWRWPWSSSSCSSRGSLSRARLQGPGRQAGRPRRLRGPPRSGYLARRIPDSVRTRRRGREQEFYTDAERQKANDERSGAQGRNTRAETGTQKDVAGAYNAVFTSVKPAGRRTSMVVDPPNGRIPATTPQVQERQRAMREFNLALLQNTPTCKDQTSGCAGGTYGPPSPRFNEVAPVYNTGRMNRHDGPEDQSLSDRCMGGGDGDFNGFRRIVQGQDTIASVPDTGQGRGYQRIVYLSGTAEQYSSPRRLARPLRRGTRWSSDEEFLAEVPHPRRRREPDSSDGSPGSTRTR